MLCDIRLFTRAVDYAQFSRVYYAEPFQRELQAAIDLKERTVRERVELPDGRQRMVVYVAPRVELPALIAKLARGYSIGYEETIIFDPAARCARSTICTPGGDLLQVAAETRFSESRDGVHTHIRLEVRVKIIGVGGTIEKFVANETRKRYEVVERVLQAYMDAGRHREPVPEGHT